MEINEYEIGERILFRVFGEDELRDGIIEEFSPSGEYVKIDGRWYYKDSIYVKEKLFK